MINAYYPTKKILEDEIDLIVWRDEFKDLDKDLVLDITRKICRTEENNFNVSIARIKNEYHKQAREIKQEEERLKRLNNTIVPSDKAISQALVKLKNKGLYYEKA